MIAMSLFYYCKNVFILMNLWMIGKNLMEYSHLKINMEDVTDAD